MYESGAKMYIVCVCYVKDEVMEQYIIVRDVILL